MTPTDLKAWRARMGYTQRQMAAAMGVATRSYRALETGYRPIQRYHVRLIELIEERMCLVDQINTLRDERMNLRGSFG